MPYTINKTNGTLISTIQDGTVNAKTLDITLVGKNFSGYGNIFNKNFVQLLENFANITPPLNPLVGELYYNTSLRTLRINTGVGPDPWKSVGIIENSNSQPSGYNAGNLWWNTDEGRLYGYTGSGDAWTLIGPLISKNAASGAFEISVLRNTIGSDSVLALVSSGDLTKPQAIVSNISNGGTLSTDLRFESFPMIEKGIMLPATSGFTPGVSYFNEVGSILWGTASSAIGLVDEVRGTILTSSHFVKFNDLEKIPFEVNINSDRGLLVNGVIKMHVTNSVIGNITNIQGSPIYFNIGTSNSTSSVSGSYYNIFSISTGSNNDPKILPNSTATVYIGTQTQPFSYLYVNTATCSTINGTTINDSNNRVITSFSVNVGRGLDLGNIQSQTLTGPTGSFTLVNTGTLTITGTTNQINVTAGQYPVLSLPQNINTTATVTFDRINGNSIYDSGYRVLTENTLASAGAIKSIVGTPNQILVSAANQGSVTLSLPQNIDTNATVNFQRLNATSIFENGSEVLTRSSISGTTNQVNVDSSAGSGIRISLPQNIDTTSNPTFNTVTASLIGTASDATKLNGQNASYYQQALNFTPIQQGGGSGQTSNTIKIGWSPNGLKAQIDISDQGFFWLGQQATSSFSPNGFQILPSGLIIQWGNTNINGFVSFPMAFPNNCLSISGSGNGMFVFPGNPWEFAYSLMASNLTKTGFTNNNPGPGGGSGGYNQTQYYIAIGF